MTPDWQTYLKNYDRIVLDFSAPLNMCSSERDELLCLLPAGSWQVAVPGSFEIDLEITAAADDVDQRSLAVRLQQLEEQLREQQRFFLFKGVYGAREIVRKLGTGSDRVCFVFHYISEFAEEVLLAGEDLRAGLLVVGPDGRLTAPAAGDGPDRMAGYRQLCALEVNRQTFVRGAVLADFDAREGAAVITGDRSRIILGRMLGQGGEGRVFLCDYDPDGTGVQYVVKIYHRGMLNMLRLMKLKRMEEMQVSYPGICWPQRMVYTDTPKGRPLGYLMKGVSGRDLASVCVSPDKVQRLYPNWRRRDLVRLCIYILERFQYLHLFGILIGDMRLKNVVVDEAGRPSLMDIDSAQVADIPCPVGYADYTPPEMQEVEFSRQLRSYDSESWAVAVLVFKILFFGLHPFQRVGGGETIEQDIRDGIFPYPEEGDQDYSLVPWGGYAQIWRYMPLPMRRLFRSIFVQGRRASLTEMLGMLRMYAKVLEKGLIPEGDRLFWDTEGP